MGSTCVLTALALLVGAVALAGFVAYRLVFRVNPLDLPDDPLQ